jgi:hypothetical protein
MSCPCQMALGIENLKKARLRLPDYMGDRVR